MTASTAPKVSEIESWNADAWRELAACRGTPTSAFFPTVENRGRATVKHSDKPEVRAAKVICLTCTVRTSCLEFALTTEQEHGVWGGMDENERRSILRRARDKRRRENRLAEAN